MGDLNKSKFSILNDNLAEQNKKTIAGRAEPSSRGRGAEPPSPSADGEIPLKKSSARVN